MERIRTLCQHISITLHVTEMTLKYLCQVDGYVRFPSSYSLKYLPKCGDAIKVRNPIAIKDWNSWDGKTANIGIVDDMPRLMLGS